MSDLLNRQEFETRFARDLSRLTSSQRREMREKIGSPADFSRITPEDWQRWERERRNRLLGLLLLISLSSVDQHADEVLERKPLLPEEDFREISRRAARQFAVDRAAVVARDQMTRTRNELAKRSQEWQQIGDPPDSLIDSDLVDVMGPRRDAITAITQTTAGNSAGVGGVWTAARDLGEPMVLRWFTQKDSRVCPICGPLHLKVSELWQLVLSRTVGGNRALPSILENGGPPAHPNCRCWAELIPMKTPIQSLVFSESWKEEDHPREPAGSEDGGEFVAAGSGGKTGSGSTGRGSSGGKPARATSARARQIESPEFKRWFGDSKVVDEEGKPLVVYHGTHSDISEFKPSKSFSGLGVTFVSTSPAFASEYASRDGGRVIPAFVRIENPFDASNDSHIAKIKAVLDREYPSGIPDPQRGSLSVDSLIGWITRQKDRRTWGSIEHPKVFAAIKKAKFDGVMVTENGKQNYAVFKPNQIKSATGNRGTFDSKSNKITESTTCHK